jgi:hypothetical protein
MGIERQGLEEVKMTKMDYDTMAKGQKEDTTAHWHDFCYL